MNKTYILAFQISIMLLLPYVVWCNELYTDDTINTIETEGIISVQSIDHGKIEEQKTYKPGLAVILSIFPGGGQSYNKSYWKIPVIYGGFAGLMYGYNFYSVRFESFREAYSIRIDENSNEIDIFHPMADNNLVKYSSAGQLLSQREFHRRNRDLMIISISALYILNILDAYVDAHLKDFIIYEDLSLNINPVNFENISGKNVLTSKIIITF